MKILGWILLFLGVLGFLGSLTGDNTPNVVSLFWAVLGAYLISRAKKKKQEEAAKEKWAKSEPIASVDVNVMPKQEKAYNQDFTLNQKYAIISLLAFLQGASPQSAFNDEANKIVQSTISSLGLTKEEAEKHIKASMNRNPDQEIDKIMHALKEMQNPDSITDLQRKCMRIAEISGQAEMIEVVKNIFEEIRSK